ncbi:MAG TPA: zinc ribbon domain-containing protein [Vicinamibacterales bacterium]|nr:zinc ribbon domain-containing protein [Vicinamibacterales bacterium]
MTAQSLDSHLGTPIVIDLCRACQVFWFDARESLRLAPGATLALFRLIGECAETGPPRPAPTAASCPRCGVPLQRAHDRQRNTAFQYLKCPAEHGRLTSFMDFLREKDFVRPLSPAQIDELRRHVQQVQCSSCGAPIELSRQSACAHCGSPLSMLDLKQAGDLVAQLRAAEAQRAGERAVDPAMPMHLERARREVDTAFAAFEQDDRWFADASSIGLVNAGLGAIARWLTSGAMPAGKRPGDV